MRYVAVCAVVLAGHGCSGCRDAPGEAARTDAGAAAPGAASLFGGERGLDHVGIAVKDLQATTHRYHDGLGFNRPTEGTLPNGIRNVNYYFGDSTYLETLVSWDRARAPRIAAFTDQHSGALFAVLSVLSAEGTTAYLAGRGFRLGAPLPGTIQTAGDDAMPEEKWKTLFLPDGTLPGDPIYFIAYSRAPRDAYLRELEDPRARRALHHRNTALGLRAVWIAVADLEGAGKACERVGLPRGRAFDDASLGARGQVFGANAGELGLVAPASPDGNVAAFLRERGGAGIVGITLAAGSVATAAQVIEEGTGSRLLAYAGQLGPSIRVPPELTDGVWLELAQQP